MIELLKYLANNLGPEQLLEVAHIIAKNPDLITQDEFMEIVNEVNDYEKDEKEITLDQFLEDNNISLN
jgi:ABC-type branched-subunit amino acid transport system ATPase component